MTAKVTAQNSTTTMKPVLCACEPQPPSQHFLARGPPAGPPPGPPLQPQPQQPGNPFGRHPAAEMASM
ncbi:hypothetical protein M407DRAFT_240776 [Tulasnella calospora MUT 4182]|uniref:Uncharacterized protein n=1 Tax=Tulasnella calospora MUT 4182 TaxID=1051891 RepID=A0A0C3QY86_9AGAM|nr:hypothetical protein M407DRAFT_240776 [Tulasnella calospora MUT 4182]